MDFTKKDTRAAAEVAQFCHLRWPESGEYIMDGEKPVGVMVKGATARTIQNALRDDARAKLASTKYLDSLPTSGSRLGHAFRDVDLEAKVMKLAQDTGIGAQFGGKYFCHDVRVIRLPRHGASCPVAMAVSCSADRQALGKITKDGIFLEQLETDPARFLPEITEEDLDGDVVAIDLNRPMQEIRDTLSQYPVKTRVMLTGPMVVARDIAHAKIRERLEAGDGLPQYMKDHCVYYAGPA
jgi:fumarate hydratase class I